MTVMIIMLFLLTNPYYAQAQPSPTPAQIERPEPSAKPTKNPHAPHHHFDVRHPHKSTRPKIKNPVDAPD